MTSQKSPWREAVIYQVYPWTFNEDKEREPQQGNGSIQGITEKLPYLQDLGVDAIWISPPYNSPMIDGGYDITDHTDINPSLGTLEDMDELLVKSHERGIRLMLDFVPNHTSDQHEWFQKSRLQEEGYDDWYIWHPGKIDEYGKRQIPNNWGSVFSIPQKKAREHGELPDLAEEDFTPPVSAWRWDDTRGQYYLASFAGEQPDLNWSNPLVRNAMFDVMRFWLDRGIDGFRVDVANHLGKNMNFPDEEINTSYNEQDYENPYDQLIEYESCGHPEEMDQYIWEMGQVLLDEKYEGRDLRLIMEAYMGESELHDINRIIPQVATTFNFVAFRLDWKAIDHKIHTDYYYQNLDSRSVGNQVNGNHDNPRLATRLGDMTARSAAVMNLFLPGMRFIYNGEELGLHDAEIPRHRLQDPNGLRDPERTPMIFDDTTPNGGFSNANPDSLWLPVNEADVHLSAEKQNSDPNSSLALYKAAIRLCNQLPSIKNGKYIPVHTNNEEVFAYGRSTEAEKAVVLTNFTSSTQHVKVIDAEFNKGESVLSSVDITRSLGRVNLTAGLMLRPSEAVVIVAD